MLIWFIERDLYNTPVRRAWDTEKQQKFLAFLWNMNGFREYCIERETRFIHAQANKWNEAVSGQRVENMLWFSKAKHAFDAQKKKVDSSRGGVKASRRE